MPAVRKPIPRAILTALTTFGELPLPVMTTSRSPARANTTSCWVKTCSKPRSLPIAVISGTLSVSDMTRKGRFARSGVLPSTVFARSQAMWEAVPALPPFPTMKIWRSSWWARSSSATKAATWPRSTRSMTALSPVKYSRAKEALSACRCVIPPLPLRGADASVRRRYSMKMIRLPCGSSENGIGRSSGRAAQISAWRSGCA